MTSTRKQAEPAPCPKCGKLPETIRVRSYWRTRCLTEHLKPMTGHTMKTKGAAIQEWNSEHGARQSPQIASDCAAPTAAAASPKTKD